jgi:hypothetical protein
MLGIGASERPNVEVLAKRCYPISFQYLIKVIDIRQKGSWRFGGFEALKINA